MNLVNASAYCTECNWKTDGKNSMGNSAIHYKNTKHCVIVELYYKQQFGELKPKDALLQTTMFKEIY